MSSLSRPTSPRAPSSYWIGDGFACFPNPRAKSQLAWMWAPRYARRQRARRARRSGSTCQLTRSDTPFALTGAAIR
jgi:hypothetical protein